MSTTPPNPQPSSRPGTITAVVIAVWFLGLGQGFCAGMLPGPDSIGVLLGAVLLSIGLLVFFIKGLWRKEFLGAYLNFLLGIICLVIAVNGLLGLGVAQYKVPLFFVWAFVLVGVIFFIYGGMLLRGQTRK